MPLQVPLSSYMFHPLNCQLRNPYCSPSILENTLIFLKCIVDEHAFMNLISHRKNFSLCMYREELGAKEVKLERKAKEKCAQAEEGLELMSS